MQSIHDKVSGIVNTINSISSCTTQTIRSSSSICHAYLFISFVAPTTTVHLYVTPTGVSLENEIEKVSNTLISIEEHVHQLLGGFGSVQIPLTERIETIESSLSLLTGKSRSISESMEVMLSLLID